MAYAWNGTNTFAETGKVNTFRVVGGLYAEAVQLITMDPSIKSVADLAGKKVSIGAPASGVYFNAMDVLGAANLTLDDITPQYLSFNDSVALLRFIAFAKYSCVPNFSLIFPRSRCGIMVNGIPWI